MPRRSHPRPPVDPALLNAGAADAMWTNLGDWSSASRYSEAAAALAARVGTAARLAPGDSVVDYACGFGDSLRLWIERFGVTRVVGVEPDPAVAAVVQERIARWGLSERVSIRTANAEALAPRSAAADVTAVVCVDAAYHFRTRLAWWQSLRAGLPAGARIATCDLLLAAGATPGLIARGASAVMRIPRANLIDAKALARQLEEVGIVNLNIESLGVAVLDGFTIHAPQRGFALRATRASIRALRARQQIDYALVAGVVPEA
jgi:microcystin synthetase protein McyJ